MVRLGTNPIAWANDDMPELGGATPLETCLAEARRAGYEGIELGNKFPRDAGTLRPILDRHGLALASGWWSARLLERSVEAELRASTAHADLLKAMGCKLVIVAETSRGIAGARGTPLSRRPRLSDAEWPDFCAKLTALAEALQRRDLRLAYHHHMGTVVETEIEVDRLMEGTGDAVGLLLDTGHLAFAGADPSAVARRHRRRIVHVHCKDVRPAVLACAKAEDWSFLGSVLAGVFTVPGDGVVDFTSVLKELRGYSGWLVVEAEQDPEKAHPLTYATMGASNLRRAAADAGLALG
jgi:myo-inosose-2 dehydratase